MSNIMTETIAKTLSTFTESGDFTLDDFIVFQDIDADHIAMIDRYETLRKKTSTTTAEKAEMTTLLTELEEYMPTSATWNELCACILNLEVFFRDGLVIYVKEKQAEFKAMLAQYKYCQEWNAGTSYYFGNLVSHNGYGFLNIYNNDNNDAVNLNNEPNTEVGIDTYWARFTIKGDKGDIGLSVNYKGDYSSATTYALGDACSYNNVMYFAKSSTIGNLPTNSTYWAFVDKIYIGSTSPTDTNLLWLDTSTNRLKRYTSNNRWEASLIVASEISITDSGNYYSSTNVDGVLNEIGANMIYNLGTLTTSSANTYTITNAGISSYTQSSMLGICFMIGTASTSACTININNLGAKNLLDAYGNFFSASNTLKANIPYTFRYNGTNFILQSRGGGGTTIDSHVLSGDTYTNNNGLSTGTMPINGTLNYILPINGTYSIPYGFTNGGTISQSITTKSGATYMPSTANQSVPANVFTTGEQTILGDSDLVSSNIVSTANIFGVQGSATIQSLGGTQMYYYSSTTTANGKYPSGLSIDLSGLGFTPKIITGHLTLSSNTRVFSYIQNIADAPMLSYFNGSTYVAYQQSCNLNAIPVGISGLSGVITYQAWGW